MTAERQDGVPATRRRAGQRKGGLRAAATTPTERAGTPEVVSGEPSPAAPAPAPAAEKPVTEKPATTKYTALLDDPTAIAFDELALVARRKLGRRVDKSKLLRALILLAADDAALRDQVIDQIGKSDQP